MVGVAVLSELKWLLSGSLPNYSFLSSEKLEIGGEHVCVHSCAY